jgi:hypothetical protein
VNTNRPYRPNPKVAIDPGELSEQRSAASVVPVQANAIPVPPVEPTAPTMPVLSVTTLPTYT